MDKIKLRAKYPPIISHIGDKYYFTILREKQVEWIEVDKDYDWNDEFEFVPINPQKTNPILFEKSEKVKSKSSDNEYIVKVTVYKNGNQAYSCSCPGATFRNKCKHIEEFKKKVKKWKLS